MRVATKTMYDLVKYNLSNISQELRQANTVVSTGKRINELSDDPAGLGQVLEIKSTLANIDQIGRNISLGKSWLVAGESALGSVQDLISDTQALCVEMASDTKSSEHRLAAAETVQNALDEIIALANTQVSGRYIFAGSNTDTRAFESDGTYNGDDRPFSVKTANSTVIQIGSDGEAVFSDIFTTFNDLITDLRTNDVDGILNSLDSLDLNFNDLSTKISDVGSKMNRLEIKENILQELAITNTERLSLIEDADIAEAVMNLKAVELTYQAALKSSASIMELSLVDYIK